MQPQQPQDGNAGMSIDQEYEQASQQPREPFTPQQHLEGLIATVKAAGMPVFCEDTSIGCMEKIVYISEAYVQFSAEKMQQRPSAGSGSSTHSSFPAAKEFFLRSCCNRAFGLFQ
jgi:hypothetical protein